MKTVDMQFLQLEILQSVFKIRLPIALICIALVVVSLLLFSNAFPALILFIILIEGITAFIKKKREVRKLSAEDIRVKKRIALDKYIRDGSYRLAFDGEMKDYKIPKHFYENEYIEGRMFYIVEYAEPKKGRGSLLGIYPASKYKIGTDLICD